MNSFKKGGDNEWHSIDGSIIRAHRHAAGARGGQENQALGRSCGGFSSRIHAKIDAFGLPICFLITEGKSSDIGMAEQLVGDDECDFLLADKGYDSDAFRATLNSKNITPVIPGRRNRLVEIEYDKDIYKERNAVERFFGKIKKYRRIATRYDKTMIMYKGALTLIAILMWIKL